jgi:hypothetical protein
MGKKVLSPSELIELRTRQKEEEEFFAAKLKEENKIQEKLKRILSPNDLLGPKQKSEPVIEKVIESIEKTKDPIEVLHERIEEVSSTIKEPKYYDKEISQVNTVIEEIKKSIPKVPEVKYYDREIQSILEKLDSLDIRYYESDIQFINERLNKLRDFEVRNNKDIRLAIDKIVEDIESFYELEILDPKETHRYIDLIKESFSKKVEDLKLQLSELPEVKYYDDDLLELKELIESVRTSIPEIPAIKYYDKELECIIETIENVRSSIPELPEVRYYENEILQLEEYIKEVEQKISKLPEVRYYDDQILRLNESIKNVENKIPSIPEFPKLPEVKYYDSEISEVNNNLEKIKKDIYEIQKSVDGIEIPEQIDWSNQIKDIYEQIKKLSEVPVISESTDPLIPLDQNFVTLDDLQNHYKLFINRVQQQLSTLGGGGETRLEFLDDIDRNTAKTNNYYLKYDSSLGKWVGDIGGGGSGSQTLDQTLGLGNTSSLGMSVGVITATKFVGDGSLLTNLPGGGGNSGYANTAGIATYASSSGIATYASTAGISTSSHGLIGTPNITVGVLTATTLGLNVANIISGVVTTTTATETSISSLSATIFRSATYQIQITEGSNYNMTIINVIHDGSTTYMSEYGTINQPIGIATFSTDINSGFLRLLAYPNSTNNTTFKVVLTAVTI